MEAVTVDYQRKCAGLDLQTAVETERINRPRIFGERMGRTWWRIEVRKGKN